MILDIQLGDVGLVIDLFGAVLLFFFGLAPLLSRNGSMSLSVGNSDYLRRKAQRYEVLSRLGVLLVFVGFLLQLLGNHIKWSVDVSLVSLLSAVGFLLLIFAIVKSVSHYRKRKYDLTAQYIPQFDELTPSHMSKQMWSFTIKNNSRRVVNLATLYLSNKPSVVTVLINGEEPYSKTSSKKVTFEDIEPSKPVVVQVWNIGGHMTAGLDCYLEVNGKIIRPKVLGFEGDEE